MKSSPWFGFWGRLFIGVIFAYAGFSKLTEPVENFRGMIAEYQVIPYHWVPAVAHVLPWLEFVGGVFLILGYAIPFSSLVLVFLSLGFLLVLGASNVLFDSASKTCGCFGQNGPVQLTVWQVFCLDLINLALGLKIFVMKRTPLALDNYFFPPVKPVKK